MDNNTGLTTKRIRFYSEEGFFKEWYADIPEYIEQGGTKGDLQMVAGADMLLDILSNDGNEVTIEFSKQYFEDANKLEKRDRIQVGNDCMSVSGGYYYIDNIEGDIIEEVIWLCDVTKWVFDGDFPLYIYYKVSPNDKTNNTN